MNPQGIYSMVSYSKALERQLETVSNNLANVETNGYKEDQPVFQQLFARSFGTPSMSNEEDFAHFEHLSPYSGMGQSFVSVADMGKNFSQGRMRVTGNDLDLALANPKGFFSVTTPQGERFTRAGNFHLNKEGQLITAEGLTINGKKGPLTIKGNKIEVVEDGSVVVDGQRTGGLKIVTFPYPERLQKMGNSLFAQVDGENMPRVLEDVKIVQGSLETSNVDTFKEMVRMIQTNRAYGSMQKALTTSDEMNRNAVTLAEV